jgi:tetratricopeptide (TPR) repeat protein
MRYQSSGSALFAAMSLSVLGIAGSALAKPESAGATVQDAGALVNEARALAKDGKLQEALTKLDAAVKARPDYTTAYSERAGVLFQLKQFDKAVADYATVIKMRPAAPAGYFNRGLALISLPKPDAKAAIVDFTKVIELNPKATPTQDLVLESFDKRAYCNILLAQWPAAVADCSEVLKRSANRTDSLINRAFAYESLTPPDTDKAIADYTTALPLVTDAGAKIDIHLNRASLYLSQKKYAPAIADLSEGIKANPKNADALQARAAALFQTGKFDLSVADYKTLVALKPNDVNIIKDLGAVQLQVKDYAGAIGTYTSYLSKAGATAGKDVYKFRAVAYMKATPANPSAAIADYQAYLAANPNDAVMWHDLAAAAFSLADDKPGANLDLALSAADKSLAITAGQADMLLVRADGLSLQGKFEAAIAAYTALLSAKTGDINALEGRGRARFNAKQFTEAITDFEAFLAAAPTGNVNKPEIERLRVLALESTGGAKNADMLIGQYTKLIDAAPDAKDSAILYTNRGVQFFNKGDFTAAGKDFAKASMLDGGQLAGLKNILSAAYKQYEKSKLKADADAVLVAADKVLAKDPKDADGTATRADVLLATKDFAKAIAEYSRILAANPNSKESVAVQMNRAAAYLQLTPPDYKAAILDLNAVITKTPMDIDAIRVRLQVNQALKDSPAVIADATKILMLAGKPDIDALTARAGANIIVGTSKAATPTKGAAEFDAAIADYNTVITANPMDATSLYNRGIAYMRKSGRKSVPELQKAIADFEGATKLKADMAEAWDRLARAYDDFGLSSEPDQEMAWTKAIDAYTKYAALPGVAPADAEVAKKRAAALKEALNG